MALTPKERDRIIEEETLRHEIRQSLHAKACAQHPRRGRWLWAAAAVALAWFAWCHYACGGRSCLMGGPGCRMHGGMMMEGKRCPAQGDMMGGPGRMAPPAEAPAKK